MYADLHLHSTVSDGTDSPARLCWLASANGVRAVSITDHDSVEAYRILEGKRLPEDLTLIPGIEISVEADHKMVHILGYYMDISDKKLGDLLDRMSAEKTESTRLNFERAAAGGVFDYEWARVLELNKKRARISGVHVVKAMRHDGYKIPGMGMWEMFKKCFSPADKSYLSVFTVGAYEAIDAIKSAGGVSALAHPGLLEDDGVITDLVSHGLMGLEVFHPTHSEAQVSKYLQAAEKEKLYVVGGTDWHGGNNYREMHFGMYGLEHEGYEILKRGQVSL